MNAKNETTLLAMICAVLTAIFAVGCASLTDDNKAVYDYLQARSQLQLGGPACVVVQDQRRKSETQQQLHGPYLYILNEAHPERVPVIFCEDLCKIMQVKQMTDDARIARAGQVLPADAAIIHITLLSWYGRLPNVELVTEQVIGALLSRPAYAEGECRFSATVDIRGKTVDLGICEGTFIFQVSRQATVTKEANIASAAAADRAMAEFLKSLESRLLK